MQFARGVLCFGIKNGDFGKEIAMKFLVLWHFDLTRLGSEVARAVMQLPDYAEKLGGQAGVPLPRHRQSRRSVDLQGHIERRT